MSEHIGGSKGVGREVRVHRACRAHRAHMLLGGGWEVRAHRDP